MATKRRNMVLMPTVSIRCKITQMVPIMMVDQWLLSSHIVSPSTKDRFDRS